MLQPDGLRLIADLDEHWGEASATALVGVSTRCWRNWKTGHRQPSYVAKRSLWCAWCFTFHPDYLDQFQDWLTWGRVRMRQVPRPGKYVEDWRI